MIQVEGLSLLLITAKDDYGHVGLPVFTDAELVTQLGKICAADPKIVRGYIFQQSIGSGIPHLAIGLEFSSAEAAQNMGAISERLSRAVKPFLKQDEYVDLVNLTAGLSSDVSRQITPFFQRS